MARDYGATQITAGGTGIEVLALGDGASCTFSARLCADAFGLYLKVTSNVTPRALIAPGVLLLLS